MAKKAAKKSAKKVKNLKARKLSSESARRVRGGIGIGDIQGEETDAKHKSEI